MYTTIKVTKDFLAYLKREGRKGETYQQIIVRLISGKNASDIEEKSI